jgi:hypothetical protein
MSLLKKINKKTDFEFFLPWEQPSLPFLHLALVFQQVEVEEFADCYELKREHKI